MVKSPIWLIVETNNTNINSSLPKLFRSTLSTKKEYFEKATFMQKGEIDPSNNYMVRADCYNLKIIDEIISELPGGAHRFPLEQASVIKKTLVSNLESLRIIDSEILIKNRNKKYLNITSNI